MKGDGSDENMVLCGKTLDLNSLFVVEGPVSCLLRPELVLWDLYCWAD